MSIPPLAVESKPINTPLLDDDGVFQVVVPVIARVWNEPLLALTVPEVAEILPIVVISPVYEIVQLVIQS